jgi:hypothetical protein
LWPGHHTVAGQLAPRHANLHADKLQVWYLVLLSDRRFELTVRSTCNVLNLNATATLLLEMLLLQCVVMLLLQCVVMLLLQCAAVCCDVIM